MRRVDSRVVGLAIGLMAFALLTSGCFQTAGASLDATPTGVSAPPQLQETQTVVVVNVAPTDAPTLAQQVAQQPTDVPTTVQVPAVTEATIVAPTSEPPTDIPTNTLVPPTDTFAPPTDIPTNTLVPPTDTPAVVAQVETAVQPSNDALNGLQATQTAVQAILFAQATQILANATATAGANQTGTSVALGTPLVQPTNTEGAPGAITNTPSAFATPTPSGPLTIVTGTPQGTPGEVGSGAAGPVTGDCIYTVIDGDRLLRIALRFGTTTNTLARLNGIVNPDMIVPGQRLHIPSCNGTPTPGPTATLTLTPMPGATATPSVSKGNYTVVQGDTLFGISTRYGVPIATIAQANGIANVNLIYIGQLLNIP